jgi:hypothetical protein
MICQVEVPNVREAVPMTPKELLKFHDDLTNFINDNWEALNKDEN